jgi:hypothetical protein
MKKLILVAAIAATVGLPSMAMAKTKPPAIPLTVPAGTVVCRPVKAGETANGSMGSNQLMCRAVNVARVNAALQKIRSTMAQNQAASAATTQSAATQQMLQGEADLTREMKPPNIPGLTGVSGSEE